MEASEGDRPIKVLVVDDDVAFLQSTVRILANAGYECQGVTNGRDAQTRLNAEYDIAAVLCDVRMPGESGLDLVATIAADFPGIAVVMATGVDDPATAALALDAGVYGYLIKPFSANEIVITLAGALRRRELEAARRIQLNELEQSVTRLRTLRRVLNAIEHVEPGSAGLDESKLIDQIARAASARADKSGAHIQRMSRYARSLAEAVGYRELSGDQFRLASALHDVGKVGVSDTILLKTTTLTPGEWLAMQRHSQVGYQLLAGSTSVLLEVAARIALGHHEWWDGGGFPRGQRGEEIPLEARIAAVADVFDSLTSKRVYRAPVSVDAAIDQMREGRGRQFEPRIFDAFVASLDEIEAIRLAHPDRDDESRIRVLIVDPDETFVVRTAGLLDADPTIDVVGRAATARESEKAALSCEPDVVLMDFELPDREGAKAIDGIMTLVPRAKVVMFTGHEDQPALVAAIGAGCAGFVAKTHTADELVDAIRSAYDGEAPAAIADLPSLLAQLRPTSRGLGSDLRPRELEVLRLMAGGLPNKALARQLHLSLNTVRNHVSHILYKLGAHSKLEAVATAAREGLIGVGGTPTGPVESR